MTENGDCSRLSDLSWGGARIKRGRNVNSLEFGTTVGSITAGTSLEASGINVTPSF